MSNEPIPARAVPAAEKKSVYPAPFTAVVEGRTKRKLGEFFGLANFGVNLTELAPGTASALLHHHAEQDEFIYVLEGSPTLVLGSAEHPLRAGDCMGFKASGGVGHQLVNRSSEPVVYLEIGDRSPGDAVVYPQDDLVAVLDPNGAWAFTHRDGTPY
jgi:uncharacterized cupin superfamily protein